ncbi:MAG TPA: hypothetical protein VHB50_09405 [Bryobacteraceae bacterium]|nr:hypothetical protein [Bryobacteraceae bacterium]
MDRIDQLEKRVSELESEKAGRSATAAAPVASQTPAPVPVPETKAMAAPATPMPGMDHPEHNLSAPVMEGATYPSLHLVGFSDLNFAATDRKGDRSGFNEGQFILHFTSALSSRVNFFAELSVTARSDAGLGKPPAPGFNFEVERSIIRFEENDHLKVSFGRYHTPINYWNTQFHHGSWLQTTISRPEMVQFGGSFIPVHFVGALAEGSFPLGGLNLNYNAGVGNGRGQTINRGGDFGDINNNRAWLLNLFSQPDHPYGLQVGASLYRDKIDPLFGLPSREWIESAHIVWQKENPEFIAEFSNVTHTPIGSPRQFNSQAWYVQTAYRLPFGERLWKPYYRFEYIHIPRGDTIFALVPDLAGSTVGVRYDITNFAALKLEYRNQRRLGIPNINGVFAQTSFTF